MVIEKNISVYAGSGQERTYLNTEEGKSNKERKTIFAGDINGKISMQDRIQQKREQAQQKALKVVREAWNGDRAMDEMINTSKRHLEELRQENADMQGEVRRLKDELKAAYDIEDGSQEQKDLDLLIRRDRGAELTEEEKEHIAELEEKGLTEYQERGLELDGYARYASMVIASNKGAIEQENAVIREIRQERRKVHPIADAMQEANDIIEASREEVIGMVMDEAKEHLDEEQEKREEQAEEIKEKREEEEELLEKHKKKEEHQEEPMEDMPGDGMLGLNMIQAKVQKDVQDILNNMYLVVEDIKGTTVDANL